MNNSDNPYGLPPMPPNPHGHGGYAPPPPPPPQAPGPYGYAGYAPPPPPPQAPNPYANPYANPTGYLPGYGSAPGPTPPGQAYNPYAPPRIDAQAWAQGYAGQQLASPGTRLVAQIIDGFLYSLAWLLAIPAAATGSDELIGGVALLAMLGLSIYQWYLLSTTGQSLGKKWMGVRVVKIDGTPIDFFSAVFMRSWVFWFAAALIPIIWLVDVLMIFGSEHRTLHDHFAKTKVVVA